MTISAKIVADSISDEGIRITTMQLRYPRLMHSELMTHRVFSRNASSSRAIPVAKLINDMETDEVYPAYWGRNKRGMQAGEEMNAPVVLNKSDFDFSSIKTDYLMDDILNFDEFDELALSRESAWAFIRQLSIGVAKAFDTAGYHKQLINRITENFGHINVVVTSTQWSNFYALRDHPDALPEIQLLAKEMIKAQEESTPSNLSNDQWHLPYIDRSDIEEMLMTYDSSNGTDDIKEMLIKVSVARCARVSYLTHDGKKPELSSDLKLYDRLLSSEPLHASPAEHQARPDKRMLNGGPYCLWQNQDLHGNLEGWIQYRKTLKGECQ